MSVYFSDPKYIPECLWTNTWNNGRTEEPRDLTSLERRARRTVPWCPGRVGALDGAAKGGTLRWMRDGG